ncbi:cell division control protein 48 [Kluyveromyces marxianus]|nr:cell division control protein 48 [Kluyveromyces marxianus]
MTKTFFFAFIPSISVNNWLTTLSEAPPASPKDPPRALAMESNSSKKTTVGAAALALSKISRMFDSDSPYHILSNSGPLTEMKLADTSVATAFASKVLPVPGGP